LREDIITITKELRNTLSGVKSSLTEDKKPWLAILSGMVGAVYSLYKAKPLLEASRGLDVIVNQADEILGCLHNEDITFSANDFSSWYLGYYLNTAEQRISACLDRTLKIYSSKKRKSRAFALIESIMTTCSHCGGLSDDSKAREILRCFYETSPVCSSVADNEPRGLALGRVWYRVNELKHGIYPDPDEEAPLIRWNDAVVGLSDLLQIYKDFAFFRKVMT